MTITAPSQQLVHDRLMTSALPEEKDFARMAAQGFEAVVNLGRPEDPVFLPEEDTLVTVAGMRYFHLPVAFSRPTFDDYEMLRDLLNILYPRRVWLHCAKNHRVSALMFLYNVIDRCVPLPDARDAMHRIWRPDEVWQAFLDEALEKYVYQYI